MQTNDMTYVIGIDTGGTFTDVVVLDLSGDVVTNNAPTAATTGITPNRFAYGAIHST